MATAGKQEVSSYDYYGEQGESPQRPDKPGFRARDQRSSAQRPRSGHQGSSQNKKKNIVEVLDLAEDAQDPIDN